MTEQKMTGKGIEMIDCFFCQTKNICKFVDGRGYVVLGKKKGDDKSFGTHAMCNKCRKS